MSKDDPSGRAAPADCSEQSLGQIARLAEVGLSVAATIHDLRQPLSSLKMALQMAREKVGGRAEATGDLDDALRQLLRVENLVERTRNMFAPPQGMRPFDLVDVIGEIVAGSKWQPGLDGRVRFEASLGEDVPAILGDRPMIEQIAVNLINNARDAVLENGGGRVLIAVRSAPGDGGAELVVADDGAGIPPEIAARMFEPFVTSKSAEKGTGLGLFIVKRAAEDHGAALQVMSPEELDALHLGRLTTGLRIAFPKISGRDSQTARSPRRPSAAPPSGRRALVVEDEPTARKLVGRILEGEGFACALCGTGEEAIAAIEGAQFDLLVADKNLPGVSGIGVAEILRRRCPRARVLIATGYPSDESAIAAMEMGVHGFLLKPLDIDALRAAVRSQFDAAPGPDTRSVPPAAAGAIAADDARGPKVLVVEVDFGVRRAVSSALEAAGCRVEARTDGDGLRAALAAGGVRILVARPEMLSRERAWLAGRGGGGPRGALAIMDRGGVDKSIEAIHCGARGMVTPPFEGEHVAAAFRRLMELLETDGGAAP